MANDPPIFLRVQSKPLPVFINSASLVRNEMATTSRMTIKTGAYLPPGKPCILRLYPVFTVSSAPFFKYKFCLSAAMYTCFLMGKGKLKGMLQIPDQCHLVKQPLAYSAGFLFTPL